MPKILFVSPDGSRSEVEAQAGTSILQLAWDSDAGIEGACEGAMACSTCHVIVDAAHFERLPPASEEEKDLLDLAWGLRPTSRLGCQVVVTDEMDGMELILPAGTNNQM